MDIPVWKNHNHKILVADRSTSSRVQVVWFVKFLLANSNQWRSATTNESESSEAREARQARNVAMQMINQRCRSIPGRANSLVYD